MSKKTAVSKKEKKDSAKPLSSPQNVQSGARHPADVTAVNDGPNANRCGSTGSCSSHKTVASPKIERPAAGTSTTGGTKGGTSGKAKQPPAAGQKRNRDAEENAEPQQSPMPVAGGTDSASAIHVDSSQEGDQGLDVDFLLAQAASLYHNQSTKANLRLGQLEDKLAKAETKSKRESKRALEFQAKWQEATRDINALKDEHKRLMLEATEKAQRDLKKLEADKNKQMATAQAVAAQALDESNGKVRNLTETIDAIRQCHNNNNNAMNAMLTHAPSYHHPPTPREIVAGIKEGKFAKILALIGAGMSTSAGIPDFRTHKTGLYATVDDEPDLEGDPKNLFTIDFYRKNQQPFIKHVCPMWAEEYKPTASHCFLKLLEPALLRVYTQNVDELETAGEGMLLPRNSVRRVHGSFDHVCCANTACEAPPYRRGSNEYNHVRKLMTEQKKPVTCHKCKGSPMKPGITFFGEGHMAADFNTTLNDDLKACDLLIVMGTSLTVEPFNTLPDAVGATVPRLLLNGQCVGPFKQLLEAPAGPQPSPSSRNTRDCAIVGDLDAAVYTVAEWMGKKKELSQLCKTVECKIQRPDSDKTVKMLPSPSALADIGN